MRSIPPSVIVLGPSRWLEDAPEASCLEETPLAARERVADTLLSMGCEATLMEDHDRRPSEEHFDLLLRVLDEQDARTFLVLWLLGARLHGLEVELGYLLTELSADRLAPEDVYLLAEKGNVGVDGESGTVAWSEPGNRTRYHEDLVALGCPVRRWRTERGLLSQARAVGLEHLTAWG